MVRPIRLVSQAKIMEHPFNCLCNATAAVCVLLHSNTRSHFPSCFSSFCFHSLHFPARWAAQGLQWKIAFCILPEEGASCTQLVCSKSETSSISSREGKSFDILAAENIADILTRPTETNLLMKSSQIFFPTKFYLTVILSNLSNYLL